MRLVGMDAITLPHPQLDLNSYTPPDQETLERRAKEAAKFSTKSGHVPHQVRPTAARSDGVLITWKLVSGLGNLRTKAMLRVLEECFRKGKDRFGFQLISFSVMSNHLHLVATSLEDEGLRKGTHGMAIRLSKAINKHFGRSGKVFRDRYHARPMYGRAAIRNAITYVLQNARKHKLDIPKGEWDPYCSARFSKGLVDAPVSEWPVSVADFFHPLARIALRLITPDIYPGHLHPLA